MREVIGAALREAARLAHLSANEPAVLESLGRTALRIHACFASEGKILTCGNGGSMADAMHFAEEWSGRFRDDRPPYPALALSDPTHMSCVGNDYGFEHIFARQVLGLGKTGDLLLVLSTSGNSRNLILAAEAAKSKGVAVIGFLGKGGGELLAMCDEAIVAPGETSDRIQELHMLWLHALIEAVEKELGH
ncbi:MAG TPA: SIS domain-containing protein [Fimbriimonadaceae bacterium]|nr:SIS domain-containing protein [Fimbriimonadaceae bacterium]